MNVFAYVLSHINIEKHLVKLVFHSSTPAVSLLPTYICLNYTLFLGYKHDLNLNVISSSSNYICNIPTIWCSFLGNCHLSLWLLTCVWIMENFVFLVVGSQYDCWGPISRASYQSKKTQGASWPHSIAGPCWSYAWNCGSLYMLSRLLGCNLELFLQAIFDQIVGQCFACLKIPRLNCMACSVYCILLFFDNQNQKMRNFLFPFQ